MTPVEPTVGAMRRILVVEDEFLIAADTAMMLEDLGYETVGPVATIAEAITAIAGEKIDAVLLDANLREISSAPVAAELVARQLPFIVVTGYGNLELSTPALNAAPRVDKPFTCADLDPALAKLFSS